MANGEGAALPHCQHEGIKKPEQLLRFFVSV